MSDNRSPSLLQGLIGKYLNTSFAGWLHNLPVVGPFLAALTTQRYDAPLMRPTTPSFEGTLQSIVYDVVSVLGYAGALAGAYEQGDVIPIRAFYIDPERVSDEQIREWEIQISQYTEKAVSLANPESMRIFIYREEYRQNLCARAVKSRKPVIGDTLYEVFAPIVPLKAKPIVDEIQKALAIEQVVAIPFFLETRDTSTTREIVGTLLATKNGPILPKDIQILSAFGRHAAAAIESERRRLQVEAIQRLVFAMQANLEDEQKILQHIVKGVVVDLGYVGAMVASYEESDDSLPVRATYIDDQLVIEEQIYKWEQTVSKYTPAPVTLSDPKVAQVVVQEEKYKDNLSVRAARAGEPVCSDELYSLLRPIAPLATRPFIQGIQETLGIRQVIAVPFFLETIEDGNLKKKFVGNLFAATQSQAFRQSDLEQLKLFGQQAAAGIRNARLYRTSEESRQKAQRYGRMAFSAAASVHALRNHIGAFRMYFQLEQPSSTDPELEELNIPARLEIADGILRHLYEPWQETSDMPADINACLSQAASRVFSDWHPNREDEQTDAKARLHMEQTLSQTLPMALASRQMLTATFRVLFRYASQSVRALEGGGDVWVESRAFDKRTVCVTIRDNGVGITSEYRDKVFDIKPETDPTIGFGAFWVKDYVQGIGGSITLENSEGGGGTFHITLPAISKDVLLENDGGAVSS